MAYTCIDTQIHTHSRIQDPCFHPQHPAGMCILCMCVNVCVACVSVALSQLFIDVCVLDALHTGHQRRQPHGQPLSPACHCHQGSPWLLNTHTPLLCCCKSTHTLQCTLTQSQSPSEGGISTLLLAYVFINGCASSCSATFTHTHMHSSYISIE
jgi:hypothetical protein